MYRFSLGALCWLFISPLAHGSDANTTLLAKGLKSPESVTLGWDGQIFVTVIGEFDKDGDGAVVLVADNTAKPFAKGLDDPKGIVFANDFLFVADKQGIWRIDPKGTATVFVAAEKFPSKPRFLNDLCADEKGTLYVSDTGNLQGSVSRAYVWIETGAGGGQHVRGQRLACKFRLSLFQNWAIAHQAFEQNLQVCGAQGHWLASP